MSLVVLDNSTIDRMLTDPRFANEFPFLKASVKKKRGCARCRRKDRNKSVDYTQIKTAVNSLSTDRKRKLKRMLGASKLRVVYVNSKRRTVRSTF